MLLPYFKRDFSKLEPGKLSQELGEVYQKHFTGSNFDSTNQNRSPKKEI
jgi:hypothetical protein